MASSTNVPVTTESLKVLEREFLVHALSQLHSKVRAWRGEAIEDDLRRANSESLQSLVDETAAQHFADAMSVLGLAAECFKSCLLDVDGMRMIAGINFRDGSGDFPFVRILRASVAPGTIADWSPLKSALSQAFSAFKPRSILFFHPEHLPLAAPTTGIDDHLLAAPARIMAARAPAAGLARVALQKCVSLDFYPRYAAIYAATYNERPALRGEVRIESEESLGDCLRQGLLFEIMIDGAWAGILAADHRTVAGITGVYMVEIVLNAAARGQQLGPAVHQRFAAVIAGTEPDTVILGTISAKNPWSLTTARRAGRIDIGAWHWIAL